MELTYRNWIELEEKVPEYLKEIVNLCAKFYKIAEREVIGKELVLPKAPEELLGILNKILNHYRGFFKEQNIANKELVEDIEKRLDSFFNTITMTDTKSKAPFYPDYWAENTTPKANHLVYGADTFLDGVIYSGLKETYEKQTQKSTFLNSFVNLSINKLGLPRKFEKESGMEDLFGTGDKEEKKKDKKKKEEKDEEEL